MSWTYAHMCRDGHVRIGHNDSEHEMCPLCIAIAQRDLLLEALELIASRAGGCQLESHDPQSDEPIPEFVAVNEIYAWAHDAMARAR